MQAIIPRYEFRAFAQNFGLAEEKMRKLSELDKFRETSEIYILSKDNNENNVKVRYDTLDIKVFVKEEKGLQQWKPRMRAEFPMKIEVLRDDLFPALDTAVPKFNRSKYTLEQFLEDILIPHPELALARVFKRRFGYTINGCISEIAELLIAKGTSVNNMVILAQNFGIWFSPPVLGCYHIGCYHPSPTKKKKVHLYTFFKGMAI